MGSGKGGDPMGASPGMGWGGGESVHRLHAGRFWIVPDGSRRWDGAGWQPRVPHQQVQTLPLLIPSPGCGVEELPLVLG